MKYHVYRRNSLGSIFNFACTATCDLAADAPGELSTPPRDGEQFIVTWEGLATGRRYSAVVEYALKGSIVK